MFESYRVIANVVAATAIVILTSTFIPHLAQAAVHSEDSNSVTVRYSSTDLETSEGVAILYRRIRAAATTVCLPLEGALLERNVLRNECFNHSVAHAVQAVHSKTLSLYHWRRIRGWKQLPIESPASLAAVTRPQV